MSNPTAKKFGHPDTLVAETQAWLVLVRPQQPTLGSLVLVCKEPAAAFAELSPLAFTDLRVAVSGIERTLASFTGYERLNYLMLMMVDRDVHFHVIPRYEGVRSHGGREFRDAGWPGVPALAEAVALSPEEASDLAAELRALWRDPAA